ncbi:AAA family ATPase [Desulfobacterales bacterium HSG2]|nr:AAA family ATPase [Desulfobacterales bacterium HSG2]
MKIISLKYEDQSRKWCLNPISFKKLTLLVGASGVGKTQILRAIFNLRNISKGVSINGLKWEIKFSTSDENTYIWEGAFENRHDILLQEDDEADKDFPKIIYEKLYSNESPIIDRNQDEIIFKGEKTVKLPQEKSVIRLLKEEDQISDIYKSFQRILFHNHSEIGRMNFSARDAVIKISNYQNIEDIQRSNESLRGKLYLASLKAQDVFDRIKCRFTDVFQYVEDLRIRPTNERKLSFHLQREIPLIQIKEKGVDEWIDEDEISSGMSRALSHISELYLCGAGTVILVDEFENSLGINCIDEITKALLTHKRQPQFIITSHHPCIINNINAANWKLITRKKGVVTAREATDFNLSRSKYEAFTQLINLDQYLEGINPDDDEYTEGIEV